jgi:outer membrane murein-binding lipoprotein Lpp
LPLVYRTLVAVPEHDGDLVAVTSTVLSRWLSKRGSSGARVDFSASGRHELSNRSRALVVRHDNPDEGLSFLRLTTESDKTDGVWRTVATAVVDPALSPWRYVWIDMTVTPSSPAGDGSERPRLDVVPPEAARMLLEAVNGHDGGHPLPPAPRIVRGRDDALVDTLVATILDPLRRLAVVATGAPRDVTVADWRGAMAGALSRCTGMCAGYVLDAAALERVGALLPPGLDVPPGGVRTFLPGVDLLDEADAARHPRMSPATLDTAREGERIRNWVGAALSRRVRDNALEVGLPGPLQAVDALLEEETDDLRRSAPGTAAGPRVSVPAARGAAIVHQAVQGGSGPPGTASALEREALEQQAQRLREEVTRLGARVSELSEERQGLLAETADLGEELDSAREQLRAARYEARWLREQAREAGLFRLAAAPAPSDPQSRPPVSVRELLERITDDSVLPHLYFTIEDATVYELSDSRKESLWVTRAWEALLALNDYARYQFDNPGTGLGFHSYLRETPDGYQVIPIKRLASQESDHVRNRGKLNDKRLFRVPEEVEPSGRVPMYAHIKLDIEYGICPRLYFYPHLGPGTTNRVYIGYLGRHLPVQQSN